MTTSIHADGQQKGLCASPDLWLKVIFEALPGVQRAVGATDIPQLLGRERPRTPKDPPYSLQRVTNAIIAAFCDEEDLRELESAARRDEVGRASEALHARVLHRLRSAINLPHPHLSLYALSNWQTTKGVYTFDADCGRELLRTPLEQLDASALATLPEWSTYIDLSNLGISSPLPDSPLLGMLVQVVPGMSMIAAAFGDEKTEVGFHDALGPTLLVVLDFESTLVPTFIPLQHGKTLEECKADQIAAQQALMRQIAGTEAVSATDELDQLAMTKISADLLSLPLYLCSPEPDVSGRWPPPGARESKLKKGKWLVPQEPTVWSVGLRIGAAMRRYRNVSRQDSASPEGGLGASTAPHIRRAHWHGYWTGSKADRESRRMIARWLPPIPVNVELDAAASLPAVIRSVEGLDS